jgi:hypothetical protein
MIRNRALFNSRKSRSANRALAADLSARSSPLSAFRSQDRPRVRATLEIRFHTLLKISYFLKKTERLWYKGAGKLASPDGADGPRTRSILIERNARLVLALFAVVSSTFHSDVLFAPTYVVLQLWSFGLRVSV